MGRAGIGLRSYSSAGVCALSPPGPADCVWAPAPPCLPVQSALRGLGPAGTCPAGPCRASRRSVPAQLRHERGIRQNLPPSPLPASPETGSGWVLQALMSAQGPHPASRGASGRQLERAQGLLSLPWTCPEGRRRGGPSEGPCQGARRRLSLAFKALPMNGGPASTTHCHTPHSPWARRNR